MRVRGRSCKCRWKRWVTWESQYLPVAAGDSKERRRAAAWRSCCRRAAEKQGKGDVRYCLRCDNIEMRRGDRQRQVARGMHVRSVCERSVGSE